MVECQVEQDAQAMSTKYSQILKKYIDAGRVPPIHEHVAWSLQDLESLHAVGKNFLGLPDFLFQKFYCFHNSEVNRSRSITSSQRIRSDSDGSQEDTGSLDLTGCPLECPFEFTDFEAGTSKIQEQSARFFSCKAEHARLIVNLYVSEVHKCLSSPLPVLVLCDGLDLQQTVLLGALKESNGVSHILATRLPGMFLAATAPPLKNFKMELCASFPGKQIPEIQVVSVYQVLESTTSSSSSLMLTCQWKDPFALLVPPSSTSLCTLDAHIALGDPRSPVASFYKELSFLERCIASLEQEEIAWHIQNTGDPVSMSERLHRLIEVTKDVRHCYTRRGGTVEAEDSIELGVSIEALLIKKRQNLDFTDELWNTLMNVSSYKELQDGFSFVTQKISNGEIRPMVLRNNKTALGQWILSQLKGVKSSLPLDGLEPLKLLAEIGLRKLQEDYCSLFIGLKLATQDILTPYFRKWDDKEADSCLQTLQATLELVLLCKVFLDLPQDMLGSFARQVLTGGKSSGKYNFTFQVPPVVLHSKLQSLNCSEWQVCGTLSSGALTMKTSWHFATKVLPHLQESTLTPGALKIATYHGTKYIYQKLFM